MTTALSGGSAAGDLLTVVRRELWLWRYQPGVVLTNLLFPVLMVLMFGGLFGGALGDSRPGSYYDLLIPGMLVMAVLFGLESTMIAVATDATRGIMDRFRSLPVASWVIVGGRCAADLLSSVLGMLVLVAVGLLLGWRPHGTVSGVLAAFGLLCLLRFSLLWMGILLGLLVKGPEGAVPVQILVWPLGFASSVFVDPATMPGWLGAISRWNPLSATADAVRELLGNPTFASSSWPSQHSLLLAVCWPLLLTVVFLPLAVRRFRRLSD